MTMNTSSDKARDNRGTLLIVLATAGSAVAVLIFQAVASRSLGTDGFAPIAVLWTVMFLLYTVLQLPAEQHLTRALVVTRSPEDLRSVYKAMLGAFGLASSSEQRSPPLRSIVSSMASGFTSPSLRQS
jgi:O-antigen/teichoic acid export membrane protein